MDNLSRKNRKRALGYRYPFSENLTLRNHEMSLGKQDRIIKNVTGNGNGILGLARTRIIYRTNKI